MLHIRTQLGVLAALGTIVVGCGSTDSSSAVAPGSAAAASGGGSAAVAGGGSDGVCATYNAKFAAMPPPSDLATVTDPAALQQLGDYLDNAVMLAKDEQNMLGSQADSVTLTPLFATVIKALTTMAQKAHGADLPGYKAAFGEFTTANDAFHGAGMKANAPNCAK